MGLDRYAPFGADHQPSSGLITGVSSPPQHLQRLRRAELERAAR